MKYYKKAAAFTMCLLISISAAPLTAAYAETEEGLAPIAETADGESDDSIVSGDFTYTVDDDGFAHITDCSSTEDEIVVPDTIDGITVAEIEAKAFLEMHIKKITIPASVTYISAENPFASLLQLQEIFVDEANKNYVSVDGVLYSKDMKTLICYPAAKKGNSFNIPDGVEELGIAAVSSTALKEIVLPESVKLFNRHCFSFNESLTCVDMSKTSVEDIPVMTFAACSSLTDVKFSESTLYIELAAFISCKSLAEIELPSQLNYIGQSAFQDTALTMVKVPDTVESIGYCAFGYDENEVPNENFVIVGAKDSAAKTYATDKDEEYDYANNFVFIDNETFAKQEAYEALDVKFFEEFEYAVIDGGACITKCTSINETLTVPAEIDGYAVTSVYFGAFQGSGSLNIILPETVKTIGEDAFSEYVENITIPGGCTEIEGDEPFLRCPALKSITVTEGDGAYSSADGVLYNKDKTTLITYPASKESETFTVPAGVKTIALSGFCYNNYLVKADLSDVETISDYAFEGCQKLETVKLSKNLKSVGRNAFLGCTSMKSIRVYGNVEMIAEYAFGYDYDEKLAADVQNNMEKYAQSGESVIMPYSVMESFKMYVEENSLAHQYAQACGIEAVTNTVAIGSKNVDKNFVYVVFGALAAAILVLIGIFTGKSIRKKKKAKESAERKAKAAEKIKAAKDEKDGKEEKEEETSDEN